MRILTSVAILLVLGACSARVFESETKAFQQGVSGAEAAWVAIWDKTDALAQAEHRQRQIREKWAFDAVGCGPLIGLAGPLPADEAARKAAVESRESALAACELIQNRADGKRLPVELAPVANRKLLPEVKAISAYADGLAALTAAPDEAAFRSASADMAASLTKVGEKLADAGEASFEVKGPVTALTAVAGELALAGLEAKKFRTLRRIVRATDGSIQNVATKFAALEPLFRQQLLFAQNTAVQKAVNELFAAKRSVSRAERAALQQAVIDRLAEYKAYAATLTSGGISYANVAAAHAALLEAVENPDRFDSAKLAFERLKELGEAAKDAKDALGF